MSNINAHGVDCSKIRVGDVVEVLDLIFATVSKIFDNGDIEVDKAWTFEHDHIEFHYARQDREEGGE